MATPRIFSVMLLILVILRASDALPRALMADETPKPDKVSQPNSPTPEKDLNKDTQPQPLGSQPDANKPSEKSRKDSPITDGGNDSKKDEGMKETTSPQDKQIEDPGIDKKDEGLKQDENPQKDKKDEGMKEKEGPQNDKKDEGIKENEGPQNNNKDDKQKESIDPLKNDDKNGAKDDGKKESKGPSNSEDKNLKKDDKQKESDGPSKSPENVKKDDGPKGNTGPSKSKEDKGPSKSKENMKKDDNKKGGKGPNGKETHEDKFQLEKCDGQKCDDAHDLVACLRHSKIDPTKLVVIVQNAGIDPLNVNIAVPTSIRIDTKQLNIKKHSTQEINISANATETLKIVLNAGKGECIIQIGMNPSVSNWFPQFPVTAGELTPLHGAYFLFFTLVIALSVWGLYKFRQGGRRAGDGVQYHQLEMSAQVQAGTENVEESTIDNWEQGWDDDWDEEEAMPRPSATTLNGNVSSNGLASRPTNKKNDWDIDWDD